MVIPGQKRHYRVQVSFFYMFSMVAACWWVHWWCESSLLEPRWETLLPQKLGNKPFPGIIAISGVLEDDFISIWLQWIFLQLPWLQKIKPILTQLRTETPSLEITLRLNTYAASIWADLLIWVSAEWLQDPYTKQIIYWMPTLILTQLKADMLNTHRKLPEIHLAHSDIPAQRCTVITKWGVIWQKIWQKGNNTEQKPKKCSGQVHCSLQIYPHFRSTPVLCHLCITSLTCQRWYLHKLSMNISHSSAQWIHLLLKNKFSLTIFKRKYGRMTKNILKWGF